MARLAVIVAALLRGCQASLDEDFKHFVEEFGKDYGSEYEARKQVFARNQEVVETVNEKNLGFTLSMNMFADLTDSEFGTMYGGLDKSQNISTIGVHRYQGEDLPAEIDWVAKGAVTPVKNQGQCGSCWAFSTTGALEGAWQIATGKLVSFSEQQLVDCAKFRYGNFGCIGGLQKNGFNYVKANALCTEDEYPYTGRNLPLTSCKAASRCNASTPGLSQGALIDYKFVESSEQGLMAALNQQPVAVNIEADMGVFKLYTSGIIQGPGCGTTLDHAVLAIGYGSEGGKKFWKVKNSWGASWGEQGYVRIIRGSDECGILNGPPLYPVVKAPSADDTIQV